MFLCFRDIVRGGAGYEAKCEVYIGQELVEMVRLDLLDQQRRYFVADKLNRLSQARGMIWDWQQTFVFAASALKQHFGGTEELMDLSKVIFETPPQPLIDPVVEDTINVWAGHGGNFKSLLSLLAAYQISTGINILGVSKQPPKNVLVLDYEESTERNRGLSLLADSSLLSLAPISARRVLLPQRINADHDHSQHDSPGP